MGDHSPPIICVNTQAQVSLPCLLLAGLGEHRAEEAAGGSVGVCGKKRREAVKKGTKKDTVDGETRVTETHHEWNRNKTLLTQ